MNIAMTGHEGLIGYFLKERLEKEGHKFVLLIDKRNGKSLSELKNMVPSEKIDMFIHAAAHCKINQDIANPELAHTNNSEGTFNALEFCRKQKIPKIVFFSSSRVLSKEKNPYTASKIYGEELCKGYKQCYGIDYLIYGPFWDMTGRLIHIYITNALEGKDLMVYGDPKTKTLDFTYIDDFVSGVMLAMNGSWNREYDISGSGEYNIYNLAEFIIKNTDSKSKIQVLEAEKAQPQKVCLDISAINGLGYKPKHSVEQGVLKTIDWYKQYLKK
jgi:nucleoside-diphosphate-sugar epimerase